MSKSYISNVNIYNYGGSNASGSFTFNFEGGSTTYNLDEEDCERIFAVAISIIERKKKAIAQALLDTPSPALLGYDSDKTIEGDIPERKS